MFRSSLVRSAYLMRRPVIQLSLTRRSILASAHQRQHQSTPVTKPSICPSCTRQLQAHVPACQSCGYISLVPPDTTYHALFGLPYDPNPFLINTPALKKEFRNAQAVCHPDTWVSKGADKQNIASNLSSLINEAYQGLLRPIKRVEYVLSLNGHALSEEDKVDDFNFIDEVIQVMEKLEGLEKEDVEEVRAIQRYNDENVKRSLEDVEGFVGRGEWSKAKLAAARLRYFDKIGQAIGRWAEGNGEELD